MKAKKILLFLLFTPPPLYNDDEICFFISYFPSTRFSYILRALYIIHVTKYVFNTFMIYRLSARGCAWIKTDISHAKKWNAQPVRHRKEIICFSRKKVVLFTSFLYISNGTRELLFPPNASSNIYLFISSAFCKLFLLSHCCSFYDFPFKKKNLEWEKLNVHFQVGMEILF